MKVVITFKVDEETLEMAIRNALYYRIKVNKTNLLQIIKDEVHGKGHSVIDFPEHWGDDLMDIDDEEVEMLVNKYRNLIGK